MIDEVIIEELPINLATMNFQVIKTNDKYFISKHKRPQK